MLKRVYLIKNTLTNHFKIGIARSVNDRLLHLQTANSAKLELVDHVGCENYDEVEKELHETFKIKRLEGEWFKLTNADIEFIIDRFNKIRAESSDEEDFFTQATSDKYKKLF